MQCEWIKTHHHSPEKAATMMVWRRERGSGQVSRRSQNAHPKTHNMTPIQEESEPAFSLQSVTPFGGCGSVLLPSFLHLRLSEGAAVSFCLPSITLYLRGRKI